MSNLPKDFFQKNDSHPVVLGRACDQLLGDEWRTWLPSVSRDALEKQGYGKMSEGTWQMLGAYATAKNTLLPWTDPVSFGNVCTALLGNVPNFKQFDHLKLYEMMIGVDCLRLIQQIPFGTDVKKFIAACARFEELEFLPDPLTFCMSYLCRPMYKCQDCGNTEYDDLIDGQCDVCCGRYEDGILKDQPLEGLEDRGRNIIRFDEYDYASISTRYGSLKSLSKNNIQLNLDKTDVQVGKLLAAEYVRRDFKQRFEMQVRSVI